MKLYVTVNLGVGDSIFRALQLLKPWSLISASMLYLSVIKVCEDELHVLLGCNYNLVDLCFGHLRPFVAIGSCKVIMTWGSPSGKEVHHRFRIGYNCNCQEQWTNRSMVPKLAKSYVSTVLFVVYLYWGSSGVLWKVVDYWNWGFIRFVGWSFKSVEQTLNITSRTESFNLKEIPHLQICDLKQSQFLKTILTYFSKWNMLML